MPAAWSDPILVRHDSPHGSDPMLGSAIVVVWLPGLVVFGWDPRILLAGLALVEWTVLLTGRLA